MESLLKQDSKKSFFLNLGIVLAIATTLILLFFYAYLPITTNHGETLEVPKVIGLSEEEAGKILKEHKLRFEVIDSVDAPDLPPSAIKEQNPQAGGKVKVNRKIYLIKNFAETPEVEVPKGIIYKSKKNAINQLKSKELVPEIVMVDHEYENSVRQLVINGDTIDRDQLDRGIRVKKRQVITLLVGNGKDKLADSDSTSTGADSDNIDLNAGGGE